jgi:hypothetical protein
MVSPQRIQRRRVKGWRMPEGAVYVGRGSKWGNPFRIERSATSAYPFAVRGSFNHLLGLHRTKAEAATQAVYCFEIQTGPMGSYEYDAETMAELRAKLGGRDLACWCPPEHACHADVLLELANGTCDCGHGRDVHSQGGCFEKTGGYFCLCLDFKPELANGETT